MVALAHRNTNFTPRELDLLNCSTQFSGKIRAGVVTDRAVRCHMEQALPDVPFQFANGLIERGGGHAELGCGLLDRRGAGYQHQRSHLRRGDKSLDGK